ncbi:MAG: hypothetical protein AB1454_12385 [Candidatus Auribacterota bacterium]
MPLYVMCAEDAAGFISLENDYLSQGYITYYIDQGGGEYNVPHPAFDERPRWYKVVVEQ